MSKIILLAACLVLAFVSLPEPVSTPASVTVIGGADGPTSVFIAGSGTTASQSVVSVPLKANATTGYSWTAFILSGEAVTIDSEEGTYVQDPNPDLMDGVGGTTWYTVTAAAPGQSLIGFTYGRPWEGPAVGYDKVMLAVVDEDLTLTVTDVTDEGVLTGTVTSIDEGEHSVLMTTGTHGEVCAVFGAEDALPAIGETITVYTDGTMTCSLPGIVNVLAWESVPADIAR